MEPDLHSNPVVPFQQLIVASHPNPLNLAPHEKNGMTFCCEYQIKLCVCVIAGSSSKFSYDKLCSSRSQSTNVSVL